MAHTQPKARIRLSSLTAAFLVTALTGTSWAQSSGMHSWHIDQARNNCWPYPFRSMDAAATQAPFEVMKANGWRMYNTLSHGMFSEQSQLTDAGQLRVEWIVTQAPINRRVLYVLKGANENETAARVESVQVAVSQILPTGQLPEVLVTDVEPPMASGQYQTTINRALMNSLPRPRLGTFKGLNTPGTSNSSGSGSSSSSGSGSSSSGSK